jgi:hypothetical protein
MKGCLQNSKCRRKGSQNMNRLLTRVFRVMMVLSTAALPAYTIDCDQEDGQLHLNVDHYNCGDDCDDCDGGCGGGWWFWGDGEGW